jgi:hypothetical protein
MRTTPIGAVVWRIQVEALEERAVAVSDTEESLKEALFTDDLYQNLFRISNGQIDVLKTATEKFVKAASASA